MNTKKYEQEKRNPFEIKRHKQDKCKRMEKIPCKHCSKQSENSYILLSDKVSIRTEKITI